jgi:glycosyltransferase involved in cell wall biosynthesis
VAFSRQQVALPEVNAAQALVQALPWVLERMPSGFDPIVVDNGSTDGSASVAARLGARVVTEPRAGFGAACYAGLVAASAPVVCFMDADGSLDPRELRRVVVPVLDDEADLVLGARRTAAPEEWPAHARLANRALAWSCAAGQGLL